MPKLITLNIERSHHLQRNIPFLQQEQPDVLCLQEVLEGDREQIARDLELSHHIWFRDALLDDETDSTPGPGYSGMGIFSRTPLFDTGCEYYHMPEGGITLYTGLGNYHETNANGVVFADTDIAGRRYRIATTHFTLPRIPVSLMAVGELDEIQLTAFTQIGKILEDLGPHILTGDFNAPRGRGIWEKFVAYYGKDNIPKDITSTIDPELHRKKGLEFVVDGIFSKPPYVVSDVRVVSGVSDHKAIVAQIGIA